MLAEGLVIGLHVVSLHSSPGLNNTNPGVYVKTQAGYTAGTYFNSERRQSFYLGRTFNVMGRFASSREESSSSLIISSIRSASASMV